MVGMESLVTGRIYVLNKHNFFKYSIDIKKQKFNSVESFKSTDMKDKGHSL